MSNYLTKLLISMFVATSACLAQEFDHAHRQLQEVLSEHVKDGLVDYEGIKKDPKNLDNYLKGVASVTQSQFDSWTQPQQIAFLSNAYNAYTIRLILKHYPLDSIKDIGNFLVGPWKQKIVQIFGKTETLDHIEHGLLRKNYSEPRIHFALVCAAKSCPELATEVYLADTLDSQLDRQGKIFFKRQECNRINSEDKTVYISPIFKWFSEDFEKKSGTVLAFVSPYFPDTKPDESYSVRYTDYDWSLNVRKLSK
jgi:hypothetical protein